jgi:hypothetical protein
MPAKDTDGSATAAPPAEVSEPVRVIESRKMVAGYPSPVGGKCCANAHESTVTYVVPFH